MSNGRPILSALIIFGAILPLAAILGCFLASPGDFGTVAIVLLVIGVLLIPLALRWHHLLLIVGWNATVNLFFLPGEPELWMLLAITSLFFSSLDRLLTKREPLTSIRSITWSLIFL